MIVRQKITKQRRGILERFERDCKDFRRNHNDFRFSYDLFFYNGEREAVKEVDPIRLGKVDIYPNQIATAYQVVDSFNLEGIRHVILAKEVQAGKTGTALAVCGLQIKLWLDRGEKVQVLVPTMKNSLSLEAQTAKRFERAGLDTANFNVTVCSYAKLYSKNSVAVDQNATKVLIIGDEIHLAQAEGGKWNEWVSKNCPGVSFRKSCKEWTDGDKFYFLNLTATPSAHLIQAASDIVSKKEGLKIVFGQTPENYYGVKQLMEFKRLKSNSSGFYDMDLEEFQDGGLEFLEYVKNASKNGQSLNFVVRATGDLAKKLTDVFNDDDFAEKYLNGQEFEFKKFTSGEDSRSISELNAQLSEEPLFCTIVLISGAMSVGETLDSTEYIGGWYETANSFTDTVVQQIGRLCGFGKEKDNFPIWCNLDNSKAEIDMYIRLFEEKDPTCIFNTINTKSSQTTEKYRFAVGLYPWDKESFNSLLEVLEISQDELSYSCSDKIDSVDILRETSTSIMYENGRRRSVKGYLAGIGRLGKKRPVVQIQLHSISRIEEQCKLLKSVIVEAEEIKSNGISNGKSDEKIRQEIIKKCDNHDVPWQSILSRNENDLLCIRQKSDVDKWHNTWKEYCEEIKDNHEHWNEGNLLIFQHDHESIRQDKFNELGKRDTCFYDKYVKRPKVSS